MSTVMKQLARVSSICLALLVLGGCGSKPTPGSGSQTGDQSTAAANKSEGGKQQSAAEQSDAPQTPAPTESGELALNAKNTAVAPRDELPKAFTSKSTGMKWVLIPAGTFRMGSSSEDVAAAHKAESYLQEEYFKELKEEQPQHAVRISRPFFMGVHEVTQSEYEQVMGTNPSNFSKTGGRSDAVSGQNTGKFPVEQVSWFDAVEFCNKLSAKDGLPVAYRLSNIEREDGLIRKADVTPTGDAGYRLPSEAEWEYACRAGTTTLFHFGSILNEDKASFNRRTHPFGTTTVASYDANAFGTFDMHGNVSEWCEDVFNESAYASRSGTTDDPIVKSGSGFRAEWRVSRGGSWFVTSWYTRSAGRSAIYPHARDDNYGFRVVLSASGVRTP
jgi:formylglycine-generating enzyme required for sulfatase activity